MQCSDGNARSSPQQPATPANTPIATSVASSPGGSPRKQQAPSQQPPRAPVALVGLTKTLLNARDQVRSIPLSPPAVHQLMAMQAGCARHSAPAHAAYQPLTRESVLRVQAQDPFEQFARALQSPGTLRAATALLRRLSAKLRSPATAAGVEVLLKRLFPRAQKPERYPARVFLCAFMILKHPQVRSSLPTAAFSGYMQTPSGPGKSCSVLNACHAEPARCRWYSTDGESGRRRLAGQLRRWSRPLRSCCSASRSPPCCLPGDQGCSPLLPVANLILGQLQARLTPANMPRCVTSGNQSNP